MSEKPRRGLAMFDTIVGAHGIVYKRGPNNTWVDAQGNTAPQGREAYIEWLDWEIKHNYPNLNKGEKEKKNSSTEKN